MSLEPPERPHNFVEGPLEPVEDPAPWSGPHLPLKSGMVLRAHRSRGSGPHAPMSVAVAPLQARQKRRCLIKRRSG